MSHVLCLQQFNTATGSMEMTMGMALAQHPRTYSEFSHVLDYAAYDPLPDDWLIGITDVVDSGTAIRRGAYRDVNYVGVSVVAAIGNGLGTYDFPFTFGGDGAAFALPVRERPRATAALEQVMMLAKTDFGLTLRAGLVPVADIRANGFDVRIASYAASKDARYSMFSGGGLRWAEHALKNGEYQVAPVKTSPRPDLTGLSCEWRPIPTRHGTILSLLVEPSVDAGSQAFAALARRVLAVFDRDDRQGHPVPITGPSANQDEHSVDPQSRSDVAANSDYRKYDDLLRLTLDCTLDQADTVEAILQDAAARGEIGYGMHRQSHAIMTCLVPARDPKSHLHFLDGMDGGYSKAAQMMKAARVCPV
jgi:hypothetical protein